MKRIILAILMASITPGASAKIYIDLEAEPLPLVDIDVVLPIGFEAKNQAESGAGSLLADILESGTAKLRRQEFQDELAKYGATFDFSPANQYSFWKLAFPIVEGQNYDGLIALMADLWEAPRFTNESFGVAKTKLDAALKGSLDADEGMASSTLRRWINKNAFNGFPIFLDKMKDLKLATVKEVYERDFKKAPHAWAGVVAPESSRPLVTKILQTVFKHQGEVVQGQYLKKLEVSSVNKDNAKKTKKLFLLDKPGRAQSVTTILTFVPKNPVASEELSFLFGNYLLIDSGLGALFTQEIRAKRGLAYAVFPASKYYLGMPLLGFGMNPIREKSNEAFQVSSMLVEKAFESGTLYQEIPVDVWDRQWQSFKYGQILGRSSAEARIGLRMEVVTGGLSPELYASNPEKWKTDRESVKKVFTNLWSEGLNVIAVVGDAKELRPLLERYFKDYELKVIPYRNSIHSSAY